MQVRLAVDQAVSVQWHSLWPSFRHFTAISLVGAAILSTCLFFCGGGFSWTSGYIVQDFAEERETQPQSTSMLIVIYKFKYFVDFSHEISKCPNFDKS
jgi:hypothetical protein